MSWMKLICAMVVLGFGVACAPSSSQLTRPQVTEAQKSLRDHAATIDIFQAVDRALAGAFFSAVACKIGNCSRDTLAQVVVAGGSVGYSPQESYLSQPIDTKRLDPTFRAQDLRWATELTQRLAETHTLAQAVIAEAPARVAMLDSDFDTAVFPVATLQQRYRNLTLDLTALSAALATGRQSVTRLDQLSRLYQANAIDPGKIRLQRDAQRQALDQLTASRAALMRVLRQTDPALRGARVTTPSIARLHASSAARRSAQQR